MRGALHLDDGLVGTDGMVAVLEVKAELELGSVHAEDIADRAVDNVVNRRGLCKDQGVSITDGDRHRKV